MLGTILLIVLVLLLLGALPTWGHSREWGYGPSGLLTILLIVFIILLAMGRVSLAAELAAAAPPPGVSLQPLYDQVLGVVATVAIAVVTGLGGLLTLWIKKYIGQKEAESLQKSIAAAAERGAAYGLTKAKEILGPAPTVDLKNEVLNQGAAYVIRTMPGTRDKLGMSDEAIRKLVEAQFAKAVDVPAAKAGAEATATLEAEVPQATPPRTGSLYVLLALVGALSLGLGACAGGGGSLLPKPQSPSEAVFAARTGYVATFKNGFSAYASLPDCDTAAPPCSEDNVMRALNDADKSATAALNAAETTVRETPEVDASFALNAAKNAIAAAQEILITYDLAK